MPYDPEEIMLGLGRAGGLVEPGPEAIRQAARTVGRSVASNLDYYWRLSKEAEEGPVDVVDLFCGAGGVSAGFRAVNGALPAFRLALAADAAEVARSSYSRNLGATPRSDDLGLVASSTERIDEFMSHAQLRPGHPLVLIGCAPCQGFSSHRNKAGQDDERNSLFVDFARIARQVEPDFVVVENVPEILTAENWPTVLLATEILKEAGYKVHIGVHNCAGFGVPQERFRALLLASRRKFLPPSGFLKTEQYRTVREAIGGLPASLPGGPHTADEMHYTANHRASTIETIRTVPEDGGSRPEWAGPDCLRRAKAKTGRAAYEDVYGRLRWDKPAITMTAYARNPASGRYVHPEQHRGLSVREAALIQGFPSDYWFDGGLDPAFRQVGNAVPPRFSAYLAAHLLGELLGEQPTVQARGFENHVGPSFSRLIPALKAGHRRPIPADLEAPRPLRLPIAAGPPAAVAV